MMVLIKRMGPKTRNLLMRQMRMMLKQRMLQRLKTAMPVKRNKNKKAMMLRWKREEMTKSKMTKVKKLLRVTQLR